MNARQRRKYRRLFDRRQAVELSPAEKARRLELVKKHQHICYDIFSGEPYGKYRSKTQENRHRRVKWALHKLEMKEWGLG
jgi:hypothetical protein